MFIIKHRSGTYFYNKGRIILFESEQEASNFMNIFIQYSTNRLARERRVEEAMQVPIFAMSECAIAPVDFNIKEVECGVVFCRELFENER
jgi:hypothetical protein